MIYLLHFNECISRVKIRFRIAGGPEVLQKFLIWVERYMLTRVLAQCIRMLAAPGTPLPFVLEFA